MSYFNEETMEAVSKVAPDLEKTPSLSSFYLLVFFTK